MATNAKSRWAKDDDEAEVKTRRKQEKEQKRRAREEKLETTKQSTQISQSEDQAVEPPAKRQRLSPDQENRPTQTIEGSNLLQFPSRTFGPCRNVELYEVLNNIEEGSYGKVFRARTRATGNIVALKKLKMDQSNEGFPVTGLREIQTLKASRHQHVVQLQEVVMGSTLKDVYLVMEFVEHDLKTLLEDMSEPFLPSEVKTLMLQITSATEYLHSHWILHRDLKTSNLLLNNRGEIKLADFGMARYTGNPPPRLTQLVVTLWYRAPELLLGTSEYSFEIDIWSLGCIFAELLTREPIFPGKTEVDQLSKILALIGAPTQDSWPGFRNLPNAKALHTILSKSQSIGPGITPSQFPYLTKSGLRLLRGLLTLNPDDRPTASQILAHPYFKEDPRPKPKEMFPTFPSKAGQEKRKRRATPQAPERGEAPKLQEAGSLGERGNVGGEGFSLRFG